MQKIAMLSLHLLNGNGLLMHFCDLNRKVTRMQQEKKQQHHRSEIIFMLKTQNVRDSRFRKLMIVFEHF